MQNFKLFLFGLILSTITACSSTGGSSTKNEEKFFFDLSAYFETEIQRLESSGMRVSKQLRLNDQRESMDPDSLNFARELMLFVQSDINKTSWQDKYQADTTYSTEKDIQKIVYLAKTKDLRTQKVEIDWKAGQPSKISIDNVIQSPVLESEQLLVYEPATGYSIRQTQKMRMMKPNVLEVEVDFQL